MATGVDGERRDFRVSLTVDSEEDFEYKCTRCEGKKRITEATHYCPECDKYYCKTCLELHGEFSENHTVLGEDARASWGTSRGQRHVGPSCRHHSDQHVSMFCGVHETLCCPVCVSLDHSNCKDKTYIPTIASGILNSQAIPTLKDDIQNVISRLDQIVENIDEKHASIQDARKTCRQTLENFRRKVDISFDQLQTKVTQEMDSTCKESEDVLDATKLSCQETADELKRYQKTLADTEGITEPQMFIRLKTVEKYFKECQKDVHKLAALSVVDSFTFSIDTAVDSCLDSIQSLGKFEKFSHVVGTGTESDELQQLPVQDHMYKISSKEEVKIKLDSDKRDGCIEGMCQLDSGEIILADSTNSCLKLLDQTYSVTNSLSLTSYPYAVCTVGQNLVAVAQHNNAIQFVSVTSGVLQPTKNFQLGHQCCSVTASNNKLYVSEYMGKKVLIYSSAFCFLTATIYKDTERKKLFREVMQLCANSDGSRLYVADSGNRLQTFNSHYQVIGSIRLRNIEDTSGMCMDHHDNLFLASKSSSNILQLVNNVPVVIASFIDGVQNPTAIGFDRLQTKLLVFNGNQRSTMTVFKLD